MTEDHDVTVRATERWLDEHGLPWFVEGQQAAVRRRLTRAHLVRVAVVAVVAAVLAGVAVGWWRGASAGFASGEIVFAAVVALWALRSLYGAAVVGWAARRTLRSLGLLFPLASRALPLLLLFITFLFINTEVWQVASSMRGGVLWQAVLVFAVIGVGFLVARLPEELEEYDAQLTAERVVSACERTPVAHAAASLEISEDMLERHSDVVGLERGNLVLVLLIAQAIQVLLLAAAVWLFFVVFGSVAINDEVIADWIGEQPHYAGGLGLVSSELLRVSTFLAAFAGLYFTVYAVTDGNYRKQFFTRIRRELERAVSVRLVYRSLLERPDQPM